MKYIYSPNELYEHVTNIYESKSYKCILKLELLTYTYTKEIGNIFHSTVGLNDEDISIFFLYNYDIRKMKIIFYKSEKYRLYPTYTNIINNEIEVSFIFHSGWLEQLQTILSIFVVTNYSDYYHDYICKLGMIEETYMIQKIIEKEKNELKEITMSHVHNISDLSLLINKFVFE